MTTLQGDSSFQVEWALGLWIGLALNNAKAQALPIKNFKPIGVLGALSRKGFSHF